MVRMKLELTADEQQPHSSGAYPVEMSERRTVSVGGENGSRSIRDLCPLTPRSHRARDRDMNGVLWGGDHEREKKGRGT
jgi:hypothetical protein